MTCNKQTMWKVGIGMLIVFGIAYAALPELRTWMLAAAPTLVFLLCPLSMLFAMKMMGGKQCETSRAEQPNQSPSSLDNAQAKG